MSDGGRRDARGPTLQLNLAVQEINPSRRQRTEDQDPQHPVRQPDKNRQCEQIKADVLVKQRIVLAVRHLVNEAKDQVPVTGFADRDQQCD